jgi:hypothetical protein
MRFIHILRCPVEEIKIDNHTSEVWHVINRAGGRRLKRAPHLAPRCPVPNLLRMPFVGVGLDWARPEFLFQKIAVIKWSRDCGTDRSKSRWKNKQRANKEEEALQGKPQPRSTKAYELTTTYTTFACHT